MKQIIFLTIIGLTSFIVQSQETYLSFQANYRGLKSFERNLDGSSIGSNYTRSKGFTLKADVFRRINEHYGIGAQMHYSVSQESVFGFYSRALFDTHWSNPNYVPMSISLRNYNSRYFAPIFDYQMNIHNSFTIYGSFITSAPINFYFDYRLSIYRMSESFRVFRPFVPANDLYHEIPTLSINTQVSHTKIAPGFAVGAKPQITNRIYMDINFSWDFVHFRNHSFGHWIPYKAFNGYHDYGYVTSPLKGTRTVFNFGVGIGYYFSRQD